MSAMGTQNYTGQPFPISGWLSRQLHLDSEPEETHATSLLYNPARLWYQRVGVWHSLDARHWKRDVRLSPKRKVKRQAINESGMPTAARMGDPYR